MKTRTTSWSLITLLIAAGAAWLMVSRASSTFREETFRDTGGLSVADVTWQADDEGYHIRGVLTNRGARSVCSVVLVATVLDRDDRPVAANPLINVLAVPPGAGRSFEAFVPTRERPAGVRVEVEPTLVRWEG